MDTDIRIAQKNIQKPVMEIAERYGWSPEEVELYGTKKAKVAPWRPGSEKRRGKLILVTAIHPTPAGEGKTTMSIGLADGLSRIGKRAMLALREPSMGPVFGMKGGATGGGYSQIVPMEDINLHFTGDFHALTAANNLLAAMLDNHIHHGNALGIDPRTITWTRSIDCNDRQLRGVVDGLGGKANGMPREDSFDITVATETMAILCLAESLSDLRERLGRIIVAQTFDKKPVTCADLKAQGAMTVILKDAIRPNLVQTLEHVPALVHGGPFANIAHGCNSVLATKTALEHADYVVTEAGFGADLGAEKFLDIKCRLANLEPDAAVVVATVRALKYHGGGGEDALEKGAENLRRHVANMKNVFGLPTLVCVNRFSDDTDAEIETVKRVCAGLGASVVCCTSWAEGGAGAVEFAEAVVRLVEEPKRFRYCYEDDMSIEEKIEAVAKRIYGAKDVVFTAQARAKIRRARELGLGNLPVCIAKTQYSFSDDPKAIGAAKDFTLTVRELRISAGAGFLVALTGKVLTMPGLPKVPAAEGIDIDDEGNIVGLY